MNNEYDLSKFDKVLADVAEIQEKGNFIPDCSTKEGYEASKRFVLDVTTPARKMLEQAHKETKKPFWDACKFLDSKKKELMPLLEAVEEPHKLAYKAVDEEKKRIKAEKEAAVQRGFDSVINLVNSSVGADSATIQNLLNDCMDFDVDPAVYGNRTDELINVQRESVEKLTDALSRQIQYEEMEKQRQELERQQRELEEAQREAQRIKEESERKEREALIAEQAKKEAEELAAKRLEEEKEAAKQAAEEAERKRLADIEAAKQAEIQRQKDEQEFLKSEAEAREADKKHKASIHTAALKALVDAGLSKEDARTAVAAIAQGKVPNVSIFY